MRSSFAPACGNGELLRVYGIHTGPAERFDRPTDRSLRRGRASHAAADRIGQIAQVFLERRRAESAPNHIRSEIRAGFLNRTRSSPLRHLLPTRRKLHRIPLCRRQGNIGECKEGKGSHATEDPTKDSPSPIARRCHRAVTATDGNSLWKRKTRKKLLARRIFYMRKSHRCLRENLHPIQLQTVRKMTNFGNVAAERNGFIHRVIRRALKIIPAHIHRAFTTVSDCCANLSSSFTAQNNVGRSGLASATSVRGWKGHL